MLNNIDKKLEPIGDNEETKRLADLEKIEFDVMQNLADAIKEVGNQLSDVKSAAKGGARKGRPARKKSSRANK